MRCHSFNKSVDNLPENLTEIIFGCLFNKYINNLPINLIKLTLGQNFTKKIDNLPTNLKILKINRESQRNKIKNLPYDINIFNRNIF